MFKNLFVYLVIITSILSINNVAASKPNEDESWAKLKPFQNQPGDLIIHPLNDEGPKLAVAQNGVCLYQVFPADVRGIIIGHLAVADMIRAGQVCKAWRRDIAVLMNAWQQAWLTGGGSPDILNRMHPLALLQLFDQISRQVPLRGVDYSVLSHDEVEPVGLVAAPILTAATDKENKELMDGCGDRQMLEFLRQLREDYSQNLAEDFARQVSNYPARARMLCRYTLGLDPGESPHQVLLMSQIAGADGDLRDKLEVISREAYRDFLNRKSNFAYATMSDDEKIALEAENPYELDLSPEFAQTFRNLEGAKRLFMSWKLLALLDDHRSMEKLEYLGYILPHHMWSLEEGKPAELRALMFEQPHQPLWACYPDREDLVRNYITLMEDINYDCTGHESLYNAPVLANYTQQIFPGGKLPLHMLWCVAVDHARRTGDWQQAFWLEGKMIDATDTDNIIQVMIAVRSCMSVDKIKRIRAHDPQLWDRYNRLQDLMWAYLDPARQGFLTEQLGVDALDDGSRLYIMRQIAESILVYNDPDRLHLVDGLLDQILAGFGSRQTELPLKLVCGGEAERHQIIKREVLLFKACVALNEGRFADVVPLIHGMEYFSGTFLMSLKLHQDHPGFLKKYARQIGNFIAAAWFRLEKVDRENNACVFGDEGTRGFLAWAIDERFINKFLKGHKLAPLHWFGVRHLEDKLTGATDLAE
jgi:hypothetical protein